jgi:HK97 gp10 family phage protein
MGLAGCLKGLTGVGDDISDRAREAVEKKAKDVAGDMRSFAPIDEGTLEANIDTEIIKKTDTVYLIAVGPKDRPLEAESGVKGKPYSIFQEFGTGKMAAQPFVRPAAEANKPFNKI